MLSKLNANLSSQSPTRLGFLCLFTLISIGAFDYITGYELSFSIFYLLPVGICAWYLNKTMAVIASMFASAIWLFIDFTSGHPYTNLSIPFWNAAVRLGFFLVVAFLILRLRLLIDLQMSLAQKDGLTKILNARAFGVVCDATLDLARRHGHSLTLGYIDLDGFKGVNDSLGHSAGDQILIAVAATLSGRLRATDTAARLGGDEFAILLPETSIAGAKTFFNELRSSLSDLAVKNRWPIGFSIGVAVFHSPALTHDDAIRCADNLMYQVKHTGKNNILFAEFGNTDACQALPHRLRTPQR